ncbi:hypothetical protein BU16DRAFT_512224 [Lophium mytilinum]|uniref:Uncharacterized protein n=1 Tax=Lophium mytilinum TaxID=390894 RepID=A0A6A6QPF5_9PEZI|nr:hypothetical protein BU16DRAFT_512224 [Lophium mytilinum]
MALLFICSLAMLMGSIVVAYMAGSSFSYQKANCKTRYDRMYETYCNESDTTRLAQVSGGWGGFNSSLQAASLPPDKLSSELLSFCISNGAQFVYSLLYLMLIYNITLICQEKDWGDLETRRRHLRCTIVTGEAFREDYLLQLPKYVLFPIMGYSVLTHWMIGEALQTQESVWRDTKGDHPIEHSQYIIVYAAYPLWAATVLILFMTGLCWWAFTYRREGFIPQMFGSLRACCAATSELDDFTPDGIQWGDLGAGEKFRHAGLSAEPVGKIHPNELYAGRGEHSKQTSGPVRRLVHDD